MGDQCSVYLLWACTLSWELRDAAEPGEWEAAGAGFVVAATESELAVTPGLEKQKEGWQ